LNHLGNGVRKKRRSSRSRSRRRIRRVLAALVLLTGLGFASLWLSSSLPSWLAFSSEDQEPSAWQQGNLNQNLSLLAAVSATPPQQYGPRIVYPYSIIPGGVRSGGDLREVMDHDPLVSDHFAGFDFSNARVIQLDQPKLVYLSYRLKGHVFWTSQKVTLRKGEKLITDGKITARTRCANRVSESKQEAISPEQPSIEKFEEPVLMAGTATQLPPPEMAFTPGLPGLAAANPPLAPPIGGGGFPPLFPPPVPGCPTPPPGKPNPCPPHKPPPHKPPPAVPEPGTIFLVVSGAAAIYLLRRNLIASYSLRAVEPNQSMLMATASV
jgi:hypothetical protein